MYFLDPGRPLPILSVLQASVWATLCRRPPPYPAPLSSHMSSVFSDLGGHLLHQSAHACLEVAPFLNAHSAVRQLLGPGSLLPGMHPYDLHVSLRTND